MQESGRVQVHCKENALSEETYLVVADVQLGLSICKLTWTMHTYTYCTALVA